MAERLAAKLGLGSAPANKANRKHSFKLTFIHWSKSNALVNDRGAKRKVRATDRSPLHDKDVPQIKFYGAILRVDAELGFDFLQFGEQEFTALDFFTVFEADEIGLAGGSRHAGDFIDEIAS